MKAKNTFETALEHAEKSHWREYQIDICLALAELNFNVFGQANDYFDRALKLINEMSYTRVRPKIDILRSQLDIK